MRHVVIVSAAGELGGGELSLLPVLAALAQRGRVTLMAPAAGPLEDAARDRGAEVHAGFMLPARVRASSGRYGSGGARMAAAAAASQTALARSLRELAPDLVYCNGTRPQVGAAVPAFAARIRIAWHVRDFARPGALGAAWRAMALIPAVIIANSHATAEQPALHHVRQRVLAIPNGIDLTAFHLRTSPPAGPATIGMAAHLTPWKGHERFIRTVASLRDRHPELRARIAGAELYDTAGNTGARARLDQLIAELGLESTCRIEHVPPSEMPVWLAQLSVFVHCPDQPEPFGRVLVEAMAVGVPVVAAATGGAAEVVDRAGVLLPPGDDDGLVEAVHDLLRDPARGERLARLGRERAERAYDERRYVSDTLRALERACRANG